jgi:hypothetical protein
LKILRQDPQESSRNADERAPFMTRAPCRTFVRQRRHPRVPLKKGLLTSLAAANCASITKLKRLSRHRSTDVPVNNYIHSVDIFRDHCLPALL